MNISCKLDRYLFNLSDIIIRRINLSFEIESLVVTGQCLIHLDSRSSRVDARVSSRRVKEEISISAFLSLILAFMNVFGRSQFSYIDYQLLLSFFVRYTVRDLLWAKQPSMIQNPCFFNEGSSNG